MNSVVRFGQDGVQYGILTACLAVDDAVFVTLRQGCGRGTVVCLGERSGRVLPADVVQCPDLDVWAVVVDPPEHLSRGAARRRVLEAVARGEAVWSGSGLALPAPTVGWLEHRAQVHLDVLRDPQGLPAAWQGALAQLAVGGLVRWSDARGLSLRRSGGSSALGGAPGA